MREINAELIKAHTAVRFRSEYDYALFEYYRSAKVIAFLDRAGVPLGGRVLDCGCGGGGMPLSLAEHASDVVGIDPFDRFRDAGVRLARERGMTNIRFARADGMALPFRAQSFDLVLSHAVIEHVSDALLYLKECRRVMTDDGRFYLSTAPYLSFPGAHLPRLLLPIPLHLIAGRSIAFRTFRWLARRAPWTLKEPAFENTFILNAQRGIVKEDDLLEKVRVRRLRAQIHAAGLRIVREQLWPTGTVRRLPAALGTWLTNSPITQDVLLSNIEYVLAPGTSASR
jgi:SAM-dependent methyltransferase